MNAYGQLQLITGCMFSGKTTELMRRLRVYETIGSKIFIINSVKDSRAPKTAIRSHDNTEMEAWKAYYLMEDYDAGHGTIIRKIFVPYNISVIAIDEAQFFEDLVPFVLEQIKEKRTVIVAGLDGDFKQEIFGHIVDLIPKCDSYTKLYACCLLCKDGSPAAFTKRITDESEQELVGGKDKYIAVCRRHLQN